MQILPGQHSSGRLSPGIASIQGAKLPELRRDIADLQSQYRRGALTHQNMQERAQELILQAYELSTAMSDDEYVHMSAQLQSLHNQPVPTSPMQKIWNATSTAASAVASVASCIPREVWVPVATCAAMYYWGPSARDVSQFRFRR